MKKDEDSFKSLFFHFYPKLIVHAKKYLFDDGKSEDIVQEVFIYLWENSHNIEVTSSLNAYLYAMVRNRCLNYLRSIKITDNFDTIELLADSNHYFELNNEDEKYKKVLLIVESFPERMNKVFKLKYLENYSYNEIASKLDISLNTVKTQLYRARKRLVLQIDK